ncbi:MAG: M20/M25/M40 family metallo-hydrolase [Oscillospiraceae bacterium]
MDVENIIKCLADEVGVSGEEKNAAELALEYLSKYTTDAYIKNGSVVGNFGERSSSKPHILLDAHIDQIGFIVSYITEDGFVKVGNCGGIDRRLLLAQQVVISGKSDIFGIITSTPPHLADGKEKKVIEISDIFIDTGMPKKDLEKIVNLGDKITFSTKCEHLLNNKITGKALDDRCGVAAILYAIDLLQKEPLNCTFSALFSTQEEVGERGARIAAYEIEPDFAIAVDVSFALTADDEEFKCGKLAKGGMIGIAPSLDRDFSDKMIACAKSQNIPYQIEVMNGQTGTNADVFSVTKCGVKAVTLSIPLKYMHTPVEVIDINDVKNVGEIIAACLKSFGESDGEKNA